MVNHITKIMQKTGFPAEAQAYFLDFFKSLTDYDIDFLEAMQSEYFLEHSSDADTVNRNVNKKLEEYSNSRHFDRYGFYMLFLLYCSKKLEYLYKEKGYSEELYIDLMRDLCIKNNECKKVYSVWGTFVFLWFHRHYLCTRFALGRFQFETITFGKKYEKAGIVINPNDTVYNLHIPSSGPLHENVRIDSYKKAFQFYGFKYGDKMPIVCESWLLYPESKNIYDVNSNLYSFMNDFDIISGEDCENVFPDAWRVFDMDFDGDTRKLPKKTSLQKNIVKWLESGRKIGYGYGVLIFDGEKI